MLDKLADKATSRASPNLSACGGNSLKDSVLGLLSEASLRAVWDDRTRHGVDLIARFRGSRSDHRVLLAAMKRHRKSRKRARESLQTARVAGTATLAMEKKLRKRSRRFDKSVSAYLLRVQAALLDDKFKLRVTRGPAPIGSAKQTYRLKSTGYDITYFAARILQRDVSNAFHLHPVGRTELVRAFISAMRGKWPKTIVRADVDSFYESIPHVKLLRMTDANPNLSALSKSWIHSLVASYGALSSPPSVVGLPRGVGPSAALAEAYLSKFDQVLSGRKECVYYGRYVDDVVMVMAPTEDHDAPTGGYIAAMRSALAELGLGLSSDPLKVAEHVLLRGVTPTSAEVNILGYAIRHDVSRGDVVVDLTAKRLTRLIERVERSFDVYEHSASKGGLSAKLLELRIRFLTSNTRLANSKKDAFVGIRFSNPLISKKAGLTSLDTALQRRRGKLLAGGTSPGIVRRLERYSFRSGFENVRYVRFSDVEWRQITSIWRDLV
jgi:hypothetical protein